MLQLYNLNSSNSFLQYLIMYKKTLIIIFIFLCILPVWSVRAQDASVQDACQSIGSFFDMILRFGTAFRMIPVILLGKLLTNEFVYGNFIHLDIYLYSFWNLTKNLANYMLAFLFIYKILTLIINGTDNIISELPKMLKSMIFAAILIQISRRTMGMLIDISSLGIATVASLPNQIIQQNPEYKKRFEANLANSYGRSINWNNHYMQYINTPSQSNRSIRPNTIPADTKNTSYVFLNTGLDQLLPSYQNVSWPLMIMGMSMMRFMEWYQNPTVAMTCSNIALSTMFRGIAMMLFLLPIIILLILSVVRAFLLWMYIAFSPFVWMMYGLKLGWWFVDNDLPAWFTDWSKYLSSNNMLTLIFQPIMLVGVLSVGIIFLVTMYATFALGNNEGQQTYSLDIGSYITSNNDISKFSHGAWGIPQNEFYLQWNLVSDTQSAHTSPVWYIIISIFTMFVLRGIVKLASSKNIIWTGILWGLIDRSVNLATDTLKSTTIVPIPGIWASSISSLESVGKKFKNKITQNRTLDKFLDNKNETEAKKFATLFGVGSDYDLTSNDQYAMDAMINKTREDNKKTLSSGRSLKFINYHMQTQKIFDNIVQRAKNIDGWKLSLKDSNHLRSIIINRYNHIQGKEYLEAIGVLNTDEFKDPEWKVLSDEAIQASLFDFQKASSINSQGRLIQFIHLALKDPDLWNRINKVVKPEDKSIKELIDPKKQPQKRWKHHIQDTNKIVSNPHHNYSSSMYTDFFEIK